MKKVIFTIVALCIIGTSSVGAQAVWGARIGVSRPMLTFSDSDWSDNWKGKFGLEVGPVLYYSFKNNFYLNTAAMFSIKTFKESWSDEYGYGTESLTAYYVDVPVYAGYNFKLGKVSLYAQAGPYLGVKIAENYSFETDDGHEDEGDILTRIDAGLGIMAGVNIKRFKVEVGYKWGLANVLKEEEGGDEIKMHINSLFLGVGFVF